MKPAKMQENSGIAVSLRLPALVRRPIEGLKGLAAIVPKRCAHGAEKSQGKTLIRHPQPVSDGGKQHTVEDQPSNGESPPALVPFVGDEGGKHANSMNNAPDK